MDYIPHTHNALSHHQAPLPVTISQVMRRPNLPNAIEPGRVGSIEILISARLPAPLQYQGHPSRRIALPRGHLVTSQVRTPADSLQNIIGY